MLVTSIDFHSIYFPYMEDGGYRQLLNAKLLNCGDL